jgi:hypothetical protein
MELDDPAEYHPTEFCVLYRAGYNPRQVIADARRLAHA